MANESRNSPTRRLERFTRGVLTLNAIDTVGAGQTISLGSPHTIFSVMAYRAATGTSGGSTKPSYRLQGSVDGTIWHTLGAATRTITVRSSAASLTPVTSTAGVAFIRANINLFTTSGSANADKIKTTIKILPVS